MILIIAEPFDAAALWLCTSLSATTRIPVRVVTPSQLAYAPSATHRLSSDTADVAFALADGSLIRSAELNGVVNRMSAIPQAHLARADPADRAYAAGELHAFTLGWLATLPCPVFNPPAPEALAGAWHSEMATQQLAAIAGLPPLASPATDTHFVLDGQVIGLLLPAVQRDALIQFAHLWGGRMVQIETSTAGGMRYFVAATSLVDFRRGGALLVRALAKVLAS